LLSIRAREASQTSSEKSFLAKLPTGLRGLEVAAHARHAPPAVYELAAYSIFGFCLAHGLSRRKFYYMLEAGEGPRLMKCGRRTLISVESAQRWRRARGRSITAGEERRRSPHSQNSSAPALELTTGGTCRRA
jgi:hypothetical protein